MGVITKGGGWCLAYVCLPTELLCQTLLWKPFESWFPGMQLCLCLPVHHHGCMPSCVWPFHKCVDMFRNKLCDVKITYWVGNKQISPKRTGPLKAMGSSCWALDTCSGLAAAAGILLLLCLRDLSGAYPCSIEAPCVCSSAYPHLTSGVCMGGKWEREKWMPLPLLSPQRGCCCSWETTVSWALAWGFTPGPPSSLGLVNLCGF